MEAPPCSRASGVNLDGKPIETFFDLIEFDEGRDPVATAAWLRFSGILHVPAAAIRFRLLASVLSVLLLARSCRGRRALVAHAPQPAPARRHGCAARALRSGHRRSRRAGVPTIRGATRDDVARALGYLHAQDRFFQMDLLRRRAAGELAELFGESAVPLDRDARVHGFRALARQALALLPPEQRALVEAYTAGVNAGLAALRARPFEYYVLRVRPQPWQAEDTLLVGYAMVLDLQDSREYERMLAAIQYSYGRTMLDFLAPRGTESDAALDGSTFPQPPVPGPDIIDLRKRKPETVRRAIRVAPGRKPPPRTGSPPVPMPSPSRAAARRTAPPCWQTTCTSSRRAQHLVPGVAGLDRRDANPNPKPKPCPNPNPKPGRRASRHRGHDPGHAPGHRRQQRPHRVGFHQQLRRHG